MKLKTTLSLAILAAATIAGAAQTYDVVMSMRDKSGRTVTANIDKANVAAAQKILRNGKNPQRLLDLADRSRLKVLAKDPAGEEQGPQDGFKVTFAVEDEKPSKEGWFYLPYKVYVTQGGQYGGSYYNYAYYPDEEDGWWGCYVPEGTYYVILASNLIEGDFEDSESLYVVKTAVEIKSDMTITFRQSDAKNMITSDMTFPDGTKMESNGKDYFSYFRCLNNSDGGYCFNMMSMGTPDDIVYVNDLDGRWTYAINHVGITEKGTYVNKLVERGPFTSNRHFTNDPVGYVESATRFEPLPTTDPKVNGYGVETVMTWQGLDWDAPAGGQVLFEGDYSGEVKLWMNNKRSDMSAETGFDVFASPAIVEKVDIITDEEDEDYVEYYFTIGGGPLMISESTGAPYTFVSNEGYHREDIDEEVAFFLPTVSPFDYTADTRTFFRSAPILTADAFRNFHNEKRNKDFLFYENDFSYPGFEGTYLPLSVTFTNNGKTVTMGDEEFWHWCNEGNYTPGPSTIEFSAVYAKEGDKERKVTSRYSFNSAGKEGDFAVPTVKIYQLRDDAGRYTDEAIQKGSLIFGVNEPNLTVSAEYAAESSGEWKQFEAEDLGDHYKAALADIDESLIGKRLDLRFSVADADGNSAVQTIEGAFVFLREAGVSDITENCEAIASTFYNLQGQRVASDFEGIVICVSTMADGSIRTAKRLNR